MRFAVGLVLLLACGLWMRQNGLISDAAGQELAAAPDAEALRAEVADQARTIFSARETQPLEVPIISSWLGENVMANLFNSFNAGAAGLILLLSAFTGRLKLSWVVYPAAALALAGPWAWSAYGATLRLPEAAEPTRQLAAILAGTALAVFGWMFVRR